MKTNFKIYPIALIGLLLLFSFSCKKDSKKVVPTISSVAVASSNITSTTVTCGGEIPSDGGAAVTARGVCWSLNPSPTIADNKTSDGAGSGSFTSTITGLSPGTTYFIRTYATNSIGTVYGDEVTVKTLAILSTITTTVASAITSTSVTCGGNIPSDGGAAVTARGVCWSLNPNPTIADNKTSDGTGAGSYTSTITGLTPGATYYIRTYAMNSVGTAYGTQITVKMLAIAPILTTTAMSAITVSTAVSGGNITNDGGATVTARGVCWSVNATPTIADTKTTNGTGVGSFISNIQGLISNTTYNIRAYATNSVGTSYGNTLSFKTLDNGLTGDINNFVPQSIIDTMKSHGMPIYTGKIPPIIEGIYNISPLVLKSSTLADDIPGQKYSDMRLQFYQQDNTKLTVNVNMVQGSSTGSGTTSYIVGSGNKFTVFVNITSIYSDGSKTLMVQVYSGTLEATGIKDCYLSIFMIDNYGNTTKYIPNGSGRVFYDSDGVSEKVSSLKSAQKKNSKTTKNILLGTSRG